MEYTCRTPSYTFGFDAVALGDVDGDGTIDFPITSAWSGIQDLLRTDVHHLSGVSKR